MTSCHIFAIAARWGPTFYQPRPSAELQPSGFARNCVLSSGVYVRRVLAPASQNAWGLASYIVELTFFSRPRVEHNLCINSSGEWVGGAIADVGTMTLADYGWVYGVQSPPIYVPTDSVTQSSLIEYEIATHERMTQLPGHGA